jgi:hypothetical protein
LLPCIFERTVHIEVWQPELKIASHLYVPLTALEKFGLDRLSPKTRCIGKIFADVLNTKPAVELKDLRLPAPAPAPILPVPAPAKVAQRWADEGVHEFVNKKAEDIFGAIRSQGMSPQVTQLLQQDRTGLRQFVENFEWRTEQDPKKYKNHIEEMIRLLAPEVLTSGGGVLTGWYQQLQLMSFPLAREIENRSKL